MNSTNDENSTHFQSLLKDTEGSDSPCLGTFLCAPMHRLYTLSHIYFSPPHVQATFARWFSLYSWGILLTLDSLTIRALWSIVFQLVWLGLFHYSYREWSSSVVQGYWLIHVHLNQWLIIKLQRNQLETWLKTCLCFSSKTLIVCTSSRPNSKFRLLQPSLLL